jgi:hypothetical protein
MTRKISQETLPTPSGNRPAKALVIAGILAVPIFTIWAIYRYGVPVPYLDQWELVPYLEKMHNHTLGIADIWQQHNEHRIFFPRMLMLAMARLTGWNIHYEFAACFLIACLTMLLLCSMLKRTFRNHPPAWLAVVFSLIVFSPAQHENWLWGWQMQIFMAAFGTVLAVWAIDRWPSRLTGISIAIAGAVISSYSFSNGLFTWLVILPLLLLQPRRKWGHVVIWVTAAVATIGLHLSDYALPANHQPLLRFVEAPGQFVQYVLLYIGSMFDFGSPAASAVIAVALIVTGIATSIMVLRRDRNELPNLLPWFSLAVYVILGACMTGIGRLGLGAQQALSSRYATFALLLVIPVVVIWAKFAAVCQTQHKGSAFRQLVMVASFLAVLGFFYVLSFDYAVKAMKQRSEYMSAALSGLMVFPRTPEKFLLLLHDDADLVRHHAQTLMDIGLIIPTQTDGNAP